MKTFREIILSPELSQKIGDIYQTIETEYDSVAGQIGLTCSGCPDNCCDSYFLHYTYTEWAYLWEGLRKLDRKEQESITNKAKEYVDESRRIIALGERPQLMCPLNEQGKCMLYTHRMMICRLHGIPATMTRPDGRTLAFPGCFRCQEIAAADDQEKNGPAMNRTKLLGRMAAIESELLAGRRHLYPKVKHTIAEMIAGGPPRIEKPFCER